MTVLVFLPGLATSGPQAGRSEAAPAAPVTRVEAAGPLLDICDEIRAPVEFSCRSATCGTCRLEVQSGADLLDPPGAEEQEGLRRLGAPPGHRLACRAVVRRGEGLVAVRWAPAKA